MGVLDTFYFLFEGDASKLKAGMQDAEKTTDGLMNAVVNTDKAADSLGASFLSLAKNATTMLTGVLAVSYLKGMAVASAEATTELSKTAKELRVNAEGLNDWQNAVVAAGGTQEGFNGTLANLNKLTRDPEKALMRLADRMKGMSQIRARRLGEMVGIDNGTVELLRQGRDGVSAMIARQRELGVVTQDQVDVAKKYTDQLRDTNRVYDDVRRQIATVILPIMTKGLELIEKTVRFLRDNKTFTIGFFGAIAAVITALYLPAMIRAIAATYLLLAPYIAIGAVIAAVGAIFALAYDDVMNFLDGNESVIGELSKKWPLIGVIVKDIAATLGMLWDVCKAVFNFIVEAITSPIEAFNHLQTALSAVYDAFVARFPFMKPILEALGVAGQFAADVIGFAFKALVAILTPVFDFIADGAKAIMETIGKIAAWFSTDDTKTMTVNTKGESNGRQGWEDNPAPRQEAEEAARAGQQHLAAANRSGVAATGGNVLNAANTRNEKRTDVKIGEVNIQTQATDADGISKGVATGLSSEIKAAEQQYDNGFLA